ncbi:MAG: nicotinic acid mononucleotide adenyltransferase [Flavobacteriaceae bacterium]|jgi:antitoxin component YwqK of YwqJK toxin-antitoxin module|nr:nicotinic acid mononucleotide adenyltransferase [Flavobacteriaceae bacterium]|tara:strand:- start:2144 stop:2548 length:405 start_codon:yes stop_codon:yes gene_type:complete
MLTECKFFVYLLLLKTIIMKNLMSAVFFLSFFSFINAQEKINVNEFNSVVEIEIYHDNGEVYQKGFLKNNKLHGKLESYDYSGNLVVLGEFKNGKKKGKWLFWNDNKLTEVNFKNNRIISSQTWENSTNSLASN